MGRKRTTGEVRTLHDRAKRIREELATSNPDAWESVRLFLTGRQTAAEDHRAADYLSAEERILKHELPGWTEQKEQSAFQET